MNSIEKYFQELPTSSIAEIVSKQELPTECIVLLMRVREDFNVALHLLLNPHITTAQFQELVHHPEVSESDKILFMRQKLHKGFRNSFDLY